MSLIKTKGIGVIVSFLAKLWSVYKGEEARLISSVRYSPQPTSSNKAEKKKTSHRKGVVLNTEIECLELQETK